MNSKTYQALSMSEALAEVKRDLGRDAVILHTRTVRKGKWFSFRRRRPMWEVTAAPNVNVVSRPHGRRPQRATPQSGPPEAPEKAAGPAENAPLQAAATDSPGKLDRISQMLEALVSGRAGHDRIELPAPLQELHEHLRDQDVSEPITTELINELRMAMTGQELGDRRAVRARLAQLIAARIPTAAPASGGKNARGRVVVLIGPTGVGKTTTIAKLAANLKLKDGKRVGLITIDTYRIAAVDQLRTYAEIIDIPLRTVLSTKEMGQAIYAMRGMDAILIDTVGRSQNDRLRLNELRGFLTAAEADEVHLVVSATANRRCAASVVARFRPLGANRLIVTKLDEAEAFGTIVNVCTDSKLPLSYVSTGQEVPDDISVADAGQLAARIVGGSNHGT